jgi:HK97 family phage portal protein
MRALHEVLSARRERAQPASPHFSSEVDPLLSVWSRFRSKAAPVPAPRAVVPTSHGGGWWPLIRESYAGAWQQNIEITAQTVLTYAALYACVTLISSDIGKLRIKLIARDADGIWTETDNPAWSPVLRKPNHYQNRIKFLEQWIVSKLIHGNTYVLKIRDARRVVVALYVLDPTRVRPLVAVNGDVYYQLSTDQIAGVDTDVTVPASEIIHDVYVPLFHPLCGVPPLTACGLAALNGIKIQDFSTRFFSNGTMPGGILTAPGRITEEQAARVKANFELGHSGSNVGRVALLGDGLKYENTRVSALDSQLIEQLKYSAEQVCTAYHVPAYMVGVGPPPSNTNVEALALQYYTQCLQTLIECVELGLDEGLSLPADVGVELDLNDLLRMDTASRVTAARDAVGAAVMSINEARRQYFGLGPVKGGDQPFLQQQYFSLEALAAATPPTSGAPPEPPRNPDDDEPDDENDDDDDDPPEDVERALTVAITKELDQWHA